MHPYGAIYGLMAFLGRPTALLFIDYSELNRFVTSM